MGKCFYIWIFSFFKKYFIYLFLKSVRKGEREGKKHQCVAASQGPPTGDLACNPGMCPDWDLNPWPFGLLTGAQFTEPHQPGPYIWIFKQLFPHLRMCLLILERGEGREREGEKHQCEREASISCLSHVPQLGTEPATQACAPTANWTCDLTVYRVTL